MIVFSILYFICSVSLGLFDYFFMYEMPDSISLVSFFNNFNFLTIFCLFWES